MAKASASAKAQRVLRFLLGLSSPQAAAVMVVHGFSEADLDEGWRRLRAVRPVRLDVPPPPAPEAPALERLVAWERDWIPIARGALRWNFPKLHERLFGGGSPSDRFSKVLFVNEFLRRFDGLERTAEGKKARALLERRGLRQPVIDAGRAVLAEIHGVNKPLAAIAVADDRSDWPARETALWDWYLEWGDIAWRKIKDKNLLRQLGFLAPARHGRASGEQPLDPFSGLDGAEPSAEVAPVPDRRLRTEAPKKSRRRRR